MRLWKLSLCAVLGCGATASPGGGDPTIIAHDDPTPGDAAPEEALQPSTDPAVTCLRVADRLAVCTVDRAALVLGDLPKEEQAEAQAALADAAAGIDVLRDQCRAPLTEDAASFVQDMGKCLGLECAALRECVGRAP